MDRDIRMGERVDLLWYEIYIPFFLKKKEGIVILLKWILSHENMSLDI